MRGAHHVTHHHGNSKPSDTNTNISPLPNTPEGKCTNRSGREIPYGLVPRGGTTHRIMWTGGHLRVSQWHPRTRAGEPALAVAPKATGTPLASLRVTDEPGEGATTISVSPVVARAGTPNPRRRGQLRGARVFSAVGTAGRGRIEFPRATCEKEERNRVGILRFRLQRQESDRTPHALKCIRGPLISPRGSMHFCKQLKGAEIRRASFQHGR